MSIRIYKLAKDLKLNSKDLVQMLHDLKVDVRGHMSSIDDETAEIVKHEIESIKLRAKAEQAAPPKQEEKVTAQRVVRVRAPITVKELSSKLSKKPSELIKTLMGMGVIATINQSLSEETVKKVVQACSFTFEKMPTPEEALIKAHKSEDTTNLKSRPPVVTLMGHVDHGKTSLLDAIRKSKVVQTEAGGITQHIGAYQVHLKKGKVTLLDTPGHEAFTKMRARGANTTDIVILVVAADDGPMPQTFEAIDHAKAANVPIVVAVNKMDLPGASIDRVKKELQKIGLVPEDWGGKTIFAGVSARTGEGIDNLLEMLLLEAEMLEVKANPDKKASGCIVEAKLTKGKGPVATVLVQNGTLRTGDIMVVGQYYGHIRAMLNHAGEQLSEAPPSTPAEVLGLSGVPDAGELFYVVPDERTARDITATRREYLRDRKLPGMRKITLEDLHSRIREGEVKELKLILKADVHGSLEALSSSIEKLPTGQVKVNVIHGGVGSVNESDVLLASASGAIIVGFHVRAETSAEELSSEEQVEMRFYNIIYEATDEIKLAMEGMLEPKLKETSLGRAEVLQVFKVSKVGNIAGCRVVKGRISRSSLIRVLRDGKVIRETRISSLKRVKDDVREVQEGMECGIGLEGFHDVHQNDHLEAYQVEKIAQKLLR